MKWCRRTTAAAHGGGSPLQHQRAPGTATPASFRQATLRNMHRIMPAKPSKDAAVTTPPAAASSGSAPAWSIPAPPPQDLVPVVHEPTGAPAGAPPALLVLLPGGLLYPKDSARLLDALQKEQQGAAVALWVAAAAVDWSQLSQTDSGAIQAAGDNSVASAVAAAVAKGFVMNKPSPSSARAENVFVAAHSLSEVLLPGYPMRNTAGVVLLGATKSGSESFWAAPHRFPRPMMHIFGQLDGQATLCRAALAAADAARSAPSLGLRFAARTRPVAVVPGMNHAQFSHGKVNVSRGDFEADVPAEEALARVAELLRCFVVANQPDLPATAGTATGAAAGAGSDGTSAADAAVDGSAAAVEAALDVLQGAMLDAATLLSPFVRALGRPTAEDLLLHPQPQGGSYAEAFGAEMMPPVSKMREAVAHPGELAAAERFCIEVQRRELKLALPPGFDIGSVPIAATAHTTLETFIYSQALLVRCDAGRGAARSGGSAGKSSSSGWGLHVHCYLQRSPLPSREFSPVYCMKLKKGGMLALALGLVLSEPLPEASGSLSASEVNADTWAAARAQAPAQVLEMFSRRGAQLKFAPDNDMSAAVKTPVEWIQAPLQLDYDAVAGNGSVCTLTAPVLFTPIAALAAYDRGAARFTGALYLKCSSLAWMHEWLLVQGFRRDAPPAAA